MAATIVWFRRDLRLSDNAALAAAIERGGEVIPAFVHAPDEEGEWAPGAASRWWLHQSLADLGASLRRLGSRLVLLEGASRDALRDLARRSKADGICWNRCYEPALIARDAGVEAALRDDGLEVQSFNGSLLAEPGTLMTQAGGPFQVFTPFWRRLRQLPEPPAPIRAPRRLRSPARWPRGASLASLGLMPRIRWYDGIAGAWSPGEDGAGRALARFLREAFADYSDARHRPDQAGTSRLSPHLHFGEISPQQAWQGVAAHATRAGLQPDAWQGHRFLTELAWREFAHHLLVHFPHTPGAPLREEWVKFSWARDARLLAAWQRGRLGIPMVDAGMRELWATGWMHNRVRMIVASMLVKNLRLHWLEGARWFWDTLVDADLANNTLGWQWTAGCGADAAPYFRVFNPVTQGRRFDPEGRYVQHWIPELAGLPAKFIHAPWEAPESVLSAAGLRLGRDYPLPQVDLKSSREAALAAYGKLRKRKN